MNVRVLQSFPHKIGAARICTTAWHQAAGASAAGARVTLYTGAVQRPLPDSIDVRTTLAHGRLRIPYRAIGQRRALELHDRLVAHALPNLAGHIDVVHTWPLAARHTLRAARAVGIPTVLERPNAHTRFAMEVVARECARLGVALPPDQEHAYNAAKLAHEEEEYALADFLLCPSEFVIQTFLDHGMDRRRLLRDAYGFDETRYYPSPYADDRPPGLSALFVGVAAVRKGLHYALEAWVRSAASRTGTFSVAGEFLPGYREKLAQLLSHPSVRVLGHRNDVPDLMRSSDVLLLPSLEEGSPLVCMEAVACGCVPLVSDRCDEVCVDGNALVHPVGDVALLANQLTELAENRERLRELQEACVRAAPQLTWEQAGRRLVSAYQHAAASPAVL